MIGDAIGSFLSSAAGNALEDMIKFFAGWVIQILTEILNFVGTWWLSIGAPSMGEGSATERIRSSTLIFVGMAGVIGTAFALIRVARDQDRNSAENLVMGIVRTILTTAIAVPMVALLFSATDELAPWLVTTISGSAQEDGLGQAMGLDAIAGGAMTLQLAGIVMVIVPIALLGAVLNALIVIFSYGMAIALCGVLPIFAAASQTEKGRKSFDKAVGWLAAVVLFKPAAAILYGAGLALLKGINGTAEDDLGNTMIGLITGLVVILSASVAMPALAKVLVPAVGAGPAGMGASGLAMLGGALAIGAVTAGVGAAGMAAASSAGAAGTAGTAGTAAATEAAGTAGTAGTTGAALTDGTSGAPALTGGTGGAGPSGAGSSGGPGGAGPSGAGSSGGAGVNGDAGSSGGPGGAGPGGGTGANGGAASNGADGGTGTGGSAGGTGRTGGTGSGGPAGAEQQAQRSGAAGTTETGADGSTGGGAGGGAGGPAGAQQQTATSGAPAETGGESGSGSGSGSGDAGPNGSGSGPAGAEPSAGSSGAPRTPVSSGDEATGSPQAPNGADGESPAAQGYREGASGGAEKSADKSGFARQRVEFALRDAAREAEHSVESGNDV